MTERRICVCEGACQFVHIKIYRMGYACVAIFIERGVGVHGVVIRVSCRYTGKLNSRECVVRFTTRKLDDGLRDQRDVILIAVILIMHEQAIQRPPHLIPHGN